MIAFALAALTLLPAPQATRQTLVGAFYEHRYCRTWEKDGYCPCAEGYSPTYWVEAVDGKRTRVILDADVVDQYFGPSALFGKFVRIRGQEVPGEDGIVRMKSLEVLRPEFIAKSDDPAIKALAPLVQTPKGQVHALSTEVRKYLNVMVKFKESTHEEFPSAYYQEFMRSTYPGFDHWVRETSYGLVGISSQSIGWLTLPKAKESYLDTTGGEWDVSKVIADVLPMVDPQVAFGGIWGVNVFVNMDPPAKPGGAYATWSRIQADGVDRWFPVTLEKLGAHNQAALGHEDGHNFGNDHSSGPYSNPYDSKWDVNSGGAFWDSAGFGYGGAPIGIPYNAYHKRLLGWIPKERVYYAYPGTSQTVYIDRLTMPSSPTSYLMAKVYVPGYATKYFTVESRKKVGYDIGIPGEGVIIHDCDELRKVTDDYGGPRYDRAAQVVDPDNNGDPNDAAAIWVAGETYTNGPTGIQIQVVSSTPTGYNVKITVPAVNWTPGEVQSTGSAGAYTLREALRYVQEFPEQPVRFRIPTNAPGFTNGVARIVLSEPLQDIVTSGLVFDGTTQTTQIGNTNPNGPEIFIDGSGILDDQNQPRFAHGLVVKAPNVTIKGVAIGNFYASGIWAEGASTTGLRVTGCHLGLHANGSTPAGNGWDGITLAGGVTGAVVGGTSAADRNVISSNAGGVVCTDATTTGNRVLGNYIGLNSAGTGEKKNTYNAIDIRNKAHGNDIGGTAAGERNVIVGTVLIRDEGSDDNRVLGNYIGTNAAGTAGLNTADGWGIALRYGVERTIIRGNVISGNSGVGIGVGETGTLNTLIAGNKIGTNPAGTSAVPNGTGIYVFGGASLTKIGTANVADRNILSGNTGKAIGIDSSPNTRVQGNYVGLNAAGTAALPQADWAIVQWGTSATGTLIGGPNPGEGNVVAGNTNIGIAIRNGQGTIQGNTIGMTPGGAVLGNVHGVHLDAGAHDCLVGGTSSGAGNVIVGSVYAGVIVRDAGTDRNIIQGNYVGVDRNGNAKPNGGDGITLFGGAKNNVIGGSSAGAGNELASGPYSGVAIFDAATTGNSIRGNRIYRNGNLGINLIGNDGNYGVTGNDAQDADTGPNDLQNYPELGSASRTPTGTTVTGWLNAKPNRSYFVDVYVSDDAEPSGFGEGQRYLGAVSVATNGSGYGTFTLNAGVASGSWITATATDGTTGDTSEFSQAIMLPNGVVGLTISPATVNNGQSATGTVTLGAMAPTGGAAVSLTSNRANATVPASVTVPVGQFSTTFTVATTAVTTDASATITATLNAVSKSATLLVKATAFLQSFTVSPLTVKGGSAANGTVTLTAPAATGGLTVYLSETSAYVTMPATVVVAAGTQVKGFTIQTANPSTNQTATLTAKLGTITKTQTITITREPKLTGFTLNPASLVGGNNTTGTVTIDLAAPTGGTVVTITESAWNVSAPTSVTVGAGTTSKAFTIGTSAVSSAQTQSIVASLNGTTKTVSLQLLPAVYLASLTITPTSVKGGVSATGRVTLNKAAPAAGVTVTISDNLASVTTPPNVFVPSGSNTKTFTITTPVVGQTYVCTVTATHAGITRTATLTMTP